MQEYSKMEKTAKSADTKPEDYGPKKPQILSITEKVLDEIKNDIGRLENFGDISVIELPPMRVASFEAISSEPEKETENIMNEFLRSYNLESCKNGVRDFGFDCHKGREIPEGCRIYHRYTVVPEYVQAAENIEIKIFNGGKFAKLVITDPFTCDFPSGWGYMLKVLAAKGIRNRLGITEDECYSLYSCEETPCLEELYTENDVRYMALFLPIE